MLDSLIFTPISTIIPNMAQVHENSNKSKSNNGKTFEQEFSKMTGLVKSKKKDKPFFINSHGNKQIIDFDFHTQINKKKVYVDVSTTFRSDRLKQKSYNGLMYKTYIDNDVEFYMVVKSFKERGKTKNPILIEGIDKVMELDEFLKVISL